MERAAGEGGGRRQGIALGGRFKILRSGGGGRSLTRLEPSVSQRQAESVRVLPRRCHSGSVAGFCWFRHDGESEVVVVLLRSSSTYPASPRERHDGLQPQRVTEMSQASGIRCGGGGEVWRMAGHGRAWLQVEFVQGLFASAQPRDLEPGLSAREALRGLRTHLPLHRQQAESSTSKISRTSAIVVLLPDASQHLMRPDRAMAASSQRSRRPGARRRL